MKDQDDAFWNAAIAAETPNAEEMAQSEAGLRELEGTEPEVLPQAQIDAMVAAAVGPVGVPLLAHRRAMHRRLVAIAAVLFLSVSIAAVWVLWPEGSHAPDTLNYAEAIGVATEPSRVEEHKLAALFIIYLQCRYAFPELRSLCAEDVAPPLRDQARRIRDQLVLLLTRGTDRAPAAVDLGLLQATEIARDASRTIDQRQQALAHLGHICVQGMHAFAMAELRTIDGNVKRGNYRRLLLDLIQ